MNNRLRVAPSALLGLLLTMPMSVLSQGTFQNLDFEDVRNVPVFDPPGAGLMSATDALPGWTCYAGTNQLNLALYDTLNLDNVGAGVISTASPVAYTIPAGLPDGQFCASLQYGVLTHPIGPWENVPASIAQVGQVPIGAHSILFAGSTPFSVSFAGTGLPLSVMAAYPGYDIFGADISSFAGQIGELRFTSYSHVSFLDSIQFSSQVIPEPTTIRLMGFAATIFLPVCLYCRRWGRSAPHSASPNP